MTSPAALALAQRCELHLDVADWKFCKLAERSHPASTVVLARATADQNPGEPVGAGVAAAGLSSVGGAE